MGNKLLPRGSNNPDYYIIGYNINESEELSQIIFDPSMDKANSYLDSVLSSMNINEVNCRYNKLVNEYDPNSNNRDYDSSEYNEDLFNDIIATNPKIIIGLGSQIGLLFLQKRFRYITTARGRLFDIIIKDRPFKFLVTYNPTYLVKATNDAEELNKISEAIGYFMSDIEYCTKFVDGKLVDISKKDLKYAMTYQEYKDYFDEYLKDVEMPSYDIESNAKDPRCSDFRIVGFSMAPDGNSGMYVIRKSLEYEMPEDDWQKCVDLAKEYIMSRTVLVHNIMYEKPATLNEWDIDINNFEDSLIKARLLLGGATGAGLKDQCILNLGYPEWDADLGRYMDYFGVLWNKLYPTSAGNHRWDFDILEQEGFHGLVRTYERMLRIMSKIESIKEERELTNDEDKLYKSNYIDDRSKSCYEATQNMIALINEYYSGDEVDSILDLVGKEVVNLITIKYSGILPYSSIPMKIITKYGAMDSVATKDLDAHLSNRLTNESTDTVDLWHGYKTMKEHFRVGAYLEMNGLFWNDKIATENKEWLSSTAKESMVNMLMSGYLDDMIYQRSLYLLNDYVKENMLDYVEEVLGPFEVQTSGIKLWNHKDDRGRYKRVTWKNLLWALPEEFRLSKRDWVLSEAKKLIMDPKVHPTYADYKYLFNPASNKDTVVLNDILVTNEIQLGYVVSKLQEQIDSEDFDINSIHPSDRPVYKVILSIKNYNKEVKSYNEDPEHTDKKTPITQRQLFLKISNALESMTFSPNGNLLKLIEEAVKYKMNGASEPEILYLFSFYEAIGIDTEDESTWTKEFRFLYDFRMYKKCIKIISSYIDGDRVGRGTVWKVNREDIDQNKVLPVRTEKYDWNKDKADDEEYLFQPTWKVCFTGDTKVKCLDGKSYSFKELVDNNIQELWVYSCKENGEIVPALAINPRITRRSAELVKVVLDNGEEIKCTPDHPFMLRDGSYKQAQYLTPNDSLMPLYLKESDDLILPGYLQYYDNYSGEYKYVHQEVNKIVNGDLLEKLSESENSSKLVTHHIDHNKLNNNPDNLLWMTNNDHSKHHYPDGLLKYIKSDENRERCRLRMNKWNTDNRDWMFSVRHNNMMKLKADNPGMDAELGRRNIIKYNKSEEGRRSRKITSSRSEHVALFIENSKKYRQTEAFKEHCRDNAEKFLNSPENREKASDRLKTMNSDPNRRLLQVRGKIGKVIKRLIDEGLEFNKINYDSIRPHRGSICYESITKYFDSYDDAYNYGKNYNHKILSVEFLDYTEDVYDLEVPEYHNFALDAGVFEHNCTAKTLRWQSAVHTLPAGRTVKGMYTSRYKGGVIAAPDYCVTGESRIRLADNTTPMVRDLEGIEDFYTYSYDENTHRVVIGHGHDCRVVKIVHQTYRIHTNDGSVVETSAEHRFWSNKINDWKQASELEVGESLRAYHIFKKKHRRVIKEYRISKIDIIDHPDGLELYSFTVDDYHNFLFDNGILSHQSQLEVRIIAGLSNCTPMLEAYKNGNDVHLMTACGIFGKPPEEITKVERRYSKMGCVVGSTKILMPNGCTPTVDQIYRGEYQCEDNNIISYDIENSKSVMDQIVGIEQTQLVSDTVRLYFGDDENFIECTPDHPMLLAVGTYKEAKDCGGYAIETCYYKKSGNTMRIAKRDENLSMIVTRIDKIHYDEPIPVYDLAVLSNHNYPIFIGNLNHDEYVGVYSHNTFRILYGSTPEGFASQFLDGDVQTARNIFDGFYKTYPQIKEWMDKRHAEVEKYGRVSCENVGYFINIDTNGPEGMEGAYRQGGNAPIQSQGSMVAGYVLAQLNNYFLENHLKTKTISFIHDSLEFDIHPRELFTVAPKILKEMNDIPNNQFGIFTEADVTIGTSMGMENEIKEMEFSEDGNEAWMTLEGFEDDLDEMYNHWKYNAEYRVVEYEDIEDEDHPQTIYTRRRELFQEKLALGPFLGKTRTLILRKFHLVID